MNDIESQKSFRVIKEMISNVQKNYNMIYRLCFFCSIYYSISYILDFLLFYFGIQSNNMIYLLILLNNIKLIFPIIYFFKKFIIENKKQSNKYYLGFILFWAFSAFILPVYFRLADCIFYASNDSMNLSYNQFFINSIVDIMAFSFVSIFLAVVFDFKFYYPIISTIILIYFLSTIFMNRIGIAIPYLRTSNALISVSQIILILIKTAGYLLMGVDVYRKEKYEYK